MEKKITVRENFENVLTVLTDGGHTELAEFIKGRIALLDKKKSSAKKDNEENLTLTAKIGEIFKGENLCITLTDFAATYAENLGAALSTQKIRSLMKPLLEDGTIVNVKKGKNSFYCTPGCEPKEEKED